jgi:hypothetical protein
MSVGADTAMRDVPFQADVRRRKRDFKSLASNDLRPGSTPETNHGKKRKPSALGLEARKVPGDTNEDCIVIE